MTLSQVIKKSNPLVCLKTESHMVGDIWFSLDSDVCVQLQVCTQVVNSFEFSAKSQKKRKYI